MWSAKEARDAARDAQLNHRSRLMQYICTLPGYREFFTAILDQVAVAARDGLTSCAVDVHALRKAHADKFKDEHSRDRTCDQWKDDLEAFGFCVTVSHDLVHPSVVVHVDWSSAEY
jgi:hypothetical protein